MPLGQRAIAWSRRAVAGQGLTGRLVLIAGLLFIALPLYLVTGLWFDLLYAALGWLGGRRLTPRVRAVIAAATVFVLVVAVVAAWSPPAPSATPGAGSSAVALVTASPTSTPTLAPTPVATPSPGGAATSVPVDLDDGATGTAPPALPSPAATTNPNVTAIGWLPGEPDAALTPGALNPAVTQATIGTTICVSGWTATIRPSSSYTTTLKVQQIAQYGYTDTSTADYEEDHLISLELGGAPRDPANLWPEPYSASLADGRDTGARVKDTFENALKREVCAGQITLAKAQAEIGTHWVHAFYGIPLSVTASTAPTGTATTATATPKSGATQTPAPAATLSVRITSVVDPVKRGTTASVSATTTASAACTIKVTLPSGRVSTVAALLQTRTASSAGAVNWTWTVTSNTGTGTAKVKVSCARAGVTGAASTTFAITN